MNNTTGFRPTDGHPSGSGTDPVGGVWVEAECSGYHPDDTTPACHCLFLPVHFTFLESVECLIHRCCDSSSTTHDEAGIKLKYIIRLVLSYQSQAERNQSIENEPKNDVAYMF